MWPLTRWRWFGILSQLPEGCSFGGAGAEWASRRPSDSNPPRSQLQEDGETESENTTCGTGGGNQQTCVRRPWKVEESHRMRTQHRGLPAGGALQSWRPCLSSVVSSWLWAQAPASLFSRVKVLLWGESCRCIYTAVEGKWKWDGCSLTGSGRKSLAPGPTPRTFLDNYLLTPPLSLFASCQLFCFFLSPACLSRSFPEVDLYQHVCLSWEIPPTLHTVHACTTTRRLHKV